jgi:hypothetical protein
MWHKMVKPYTVQFNKLTIDCGYYLNNLFDTKHRNLKPYFSNPSLGRGAMEMRAKVGRGLFERPAQRLFERLI